MPSSVISLTISYIVEYFEKTLSHNLSHIVGYFAEHNVLCIILNETKNGKINKNAQDIKKCKSHPKNIGF